MRKNILIGIVLVLAILIQTSVFLIPNNMLDGYFLIVKPMFWLIVFAFTYLLYYKGEKFYKDKSSLVLITVFGMIIYLFALFMSGVFTKYAYNPMDLSLMGIIRNFWTYVPIILIKEYVRSAIMFQSNKKNKYLVLVIVSVVFTYLNIDNIKSLVTLSIGNQFDYLLTSLLPLLMLNLFLTYMSMNGALLSNMAFMLIYLTVPVFVPILPNIPRIYDAILVYLTLFIMYIVYDKMVYDKKQKEEQQVIVEKYHWKWIIFPGIVLTISILFGLGVFPFVPYAVASKSMQPGINIGDVILIKKATPEVIKSLEVGQVIQYRTNKIAIAHRIVEIIDDGLGNILYVTKGDNNPIQDVTPIKEEQIIGVVQAKIPYIGWPSVIFTR